MTRSKRRKLERARKPRFTRSSAAILWRPLQPSLAGVPVAFCAAGRMTWGPREEVIVTAQKRDENPSERP